MVTTLIERGINHMLNNNPVFDNINFNGGNLSSDGGAILLLNYLGKIHFEDKLGQIHFNDNRHLPVYSNSDILYQLTCRTLLGYFNQSDQNVLNEDPLLSKYFTACSQPTVSRFFDRVADQTNVEFKELLTRMACNYINKHVDAPIIDADSTLTETYGSQQASAFIHHYGEVGYHPLVINEFNSKLLMSARLRTGSAYSSNGIIEELQTIFHFMYNRGNIRFRGDSAFYDTDLLKFLEENEISYYIRAKGFTALRREVMFDLTAKGIEWMDYSHNHPYYGEMRYEIGTKDKTPRRIIYKVFSIEENGQMSFIPNIYCIVTNDETITPYEGMMFYEARGASENFTKELKGDFDAAHLSHSDFLANEMEFLISSTAYNLFHLFQNNILSGKDRNITMNTFRLMFQKIAVKVTTHARKLALSFSSAYTNRRRFMKYWNLVLQI